MAILSYRVVDLQSYLQDVPSDQKAAFLEQIPASANYQFTWTTSAGNPVPVLHADRLNHIASSTRMKWHMQLVGMNESCQVGLTLDQRNMIGLIPEENKSQ